MALHVVLFQPEIPQNTGNIARTCACAGASLHLVHPLGFHLTERNIRRSGMDYFDQVEITQWQSSDSFLDAHGDDELFLFTGSAEQSYDVVDFAGAGVRKDVYLCFGRESAGIDSEILARYSRRCVRIPMKEGRRSLNLSNSVAIALYEALRQNGFDGLV
jgi:tRNA (cytidine/uridine-2'-O-)-methyltransferase